MQEADLHSGISAIVLAAGMSRRMGTPKQLLPIGGKVLLQVVLATVRASCVDEIIIVLGESADIIQSQISFDNCQVVINEAYQQGMSTSLRAGVARVSPSAEGALIVLADQPLLRPETIDQLIDEYRRNKPQIVIPVYSGSRGNPVLLDRSVFPELAGLTGDVGCRAIFDKHTERILKVPVTDSGVLLDLDTPADIKRFEEAVANSLRGHRCSDAK